MTPPAVGTYDYRLVALSVLIAMLASYAALDLAGRVRIARGRTRLLWLLGGAMAMGIGIWAMHYVGMEAFALPMPMLYDWPTVLLSLLAAVLASATALLVVSRETMGSFRSLAGSLAMGGGIASMHYIGMYAMRVPATLVYSPWLVILSVVVAIAISHIALRLAFALKRSPGQGWRKLGGAAIMGLAIPAMHYIGMAAASFLPAPLTADRLAHAISDSTLSVASIAVVTTTILVLVFASSAIDRHLQMQARLVAESRSQLQNVFDNMAEAVMVVDQDGRVIEHNPAAVAMFGFHEDAALLRSEMTILVASTGTYTPDGNIVLAEEQPMSLALSGIYVTNRDVVYRRRDTGELLWAELTIVPMTDEDRKPIRYIVTIRDVGERRAKDEALKWLAAIVESSEDAIVGKNDKGVVTSWNKGAERIFGYTAAEMIGQSILRLLPEDRLQEEDEILRRLKLGETVDHFETVRVRQNGESIHVSLTISPIKDANGKLIGASKIARDTTEQIRLEKQVRQSQKMEALGNLTGGVAHDFNNLLGVVFGNLDLLERMVAENEAALKRVHTAQKAASRGADLTRRLLAFSSNMGLKPVKVDLHHTIRNTIELTTRLIGPDIRMTLHFSETNASVFADASALESVLINVIVNARDAMPNGGTITVSTEVTDLEESYLPVQTGELKVGRYARLSVTDTGTGMSRETMQHAFEPYYTTKPRGKGTGLGLAMVYGFAKQTGGTVRLYSEAGYGTTITLYLPLADAVDTTSAVPVEELSQERHGGKVLVVDDESDLLEIAVIYLRDMGYTTFQAHDGPAAVAVIDEVGAIDLLVTDIIMPGGINGVELAQQVKARMPATKVVYCSGFQADALEERNMPLIDGPLLQKPYHRAEFERMIHHVMDGAAKQEAV